MEGKPNLLHNVILEGRKKLSISGVEDVDSFDEHEAVIYTNMGLMEIKGCDIHMNKLNLEAGEIILEGEFDSVQYAVEGKNNTKAGFIARLLGN